MNENVFTCGGVNNVSTGLLHEKYISDLLLISLFC